MECMYRFPLSDEFSVTGVTITVGGNNIISQIMEKKQAKEKYDDAVASGNTAVSTQYDEEVPEVLQMHIGNISADSEIDVIVNIFTKCQVIKHGQYSFVFPANFLPDFVKFEREGSSVQKTVFSAKIEVVNESEVINLSVSHKEFSLTEDDDKKRQVLEIHDTKDMDETKKDIVVSFSTSLIRDTCLKFYQCEEYPNEVAAHISFIPRVSNETEEEDTKIDDQPIFEPDVNHDDTELTAGEFIFVVDRSGSMLGISIIQALNALELFIRSLPPQSKFNIVSFGSDFDKMFESSIKYDDESMEEAISKIRIFKANYGGTDIYKPLNSIFKDEYDSKFSRNIFLLTDGTVSSPQAVVNLIFKNRESARVHSFGIGSEASKYLVKESAKAGKGTYAFIGNKNDDLSEKVIKALSEASKPILTDIKINWGDFEEALTYPLSLSSTHANVFEEEPVSICAIFDKSKFQKLFSASKVRLSFFNTLTKKTQTETVEISKAGIEENEDAFRL